MVTIVKKLTGGTNAFYEFACLSTDTKPASLVPENSICHEIDTGKHFYFGNGEWKELPPKGGSGGGSGGGGLPADFPAEGSANANKFLGFDANGDYTAKDAPSGGGAEKFVVTLTKDNETWTADKTIAEIIEAYEANQVVVAKYPCDSLYVELPISVADSIDGMSAAIFAGLDDREQGAPSIITVMCVNQGSGDVIQTAIHTSTNEPLIVTMTADESIGKYVGDKTFAEVFAAMTAGKPVTCVVPNTGAIRIIDATQVDVEGEAVVLLTHSVLGSEGTASLNVISGSPNEHPYATLS